MNIEQALAAREAVKRCGTQTTWDPPAPKPYLVTYEPSPVPLMPEVRTNVETTK